MSMTDDIPEMVTQPLTFAQKLEKQGRRIVEHVSKNEDGAMVGQIIVAQKIALALDQIEHIRELDRLHHKELLQLECKIDTQIMQLAPEYGQQEDDLISQRDKLDNKLQCIDRDKRKQTLDSEALLRNMQDRLLNLLQKHAQLAPIPGTPGS